MKTETRQAPSGGRLGRSIGAIVVSGTPAKSWATRQQARHFARPTGRGNSALHHGSCPGSGRRFAYTAIRQRCHGDDRVIRGFCLFCGISRGRRVPDPFHGSATTRWSLSDHHHGKRREFASGDQHESARASGRSDSALNHRGHLDAPHVIREGFDAVRQFGEAERPYKTGSGRGSPPSPDPVSYAG